MADQTKTGQHQEESKRMRSLPGTPGKILKYFTALFGLFVILYVGGIFGYFGIYIYSAQYNILCMTIALALIYVQYPATKAARRRIPWYDYLAIGFGLVTNMYVFFFYWDLLELSYPSTLQITFGIIEIVLVLEASRRSVSAVLTLLALLFILHPLFADFAPGFLYGKAISFERVISCIYLYANGIFGSILQVVASLIIPYIIFGVLLQVSGAGAFFIDLAMGLCGHMKGGAAKVAIVASCLFGMINGSSVANTATCGVITIPLMKRIGYTPMWAAAVEAVSSNGGQIMPPVMGIAAFLMVDFLGTTYQKIMITGFIPALLYFLSIMVAVHFEAAKTGLHGLPRTELPSMKKTFKDGWIYILPIFALLFILTVLRYSAQTACIYAIFVLVIVSFFKKEARLGFKKMTTALSQGVMNTANLISVGALASILVASLGLTGLGIRVSSGLVSLAGGSMLVLLVLTAIVAIILGMGLPTSSVYILCATLIAPALVMAGMDKMVAHFFVLYYGVAALITPPVCVVSFVAANIAGSPFMSTGYLAMRVGILTFILPFIFAYSPELLLIGTPLGIVLAIVTASIGTVLLGSGIVGYLVKELNGVLRTVMLAAGILMLIPGWKTDIIGMALAVPIVLWQVGPKRMFSMKRIAAAGEGPGAGPM